MPYPYILAACLGMAMSRQPHITYWRWAYSPTTADVSLSHNHEGGPLSIRSYSDLSDDRPEKDLLFGYAIRTPYGWNLFDEQNKAVEDPNMVWKILGAIGDRNGTHPSPERVGEKL